MAVVEDLYREHILEHFESPYHKGHVDCPSCVHADKNPLCGDYVNLELRVDDKGVVTDAYFDGTGCAISQAAASILCEQIEGKNIGELREMQAQEMLDLLQVPLTATRQKCGLLSFKILKTMLYSLDAQPPKRG